MNGSVIVSRIITPLSKNRCKSATHITNELEKVAIFYGSVHHLGKFILNLSQLCHPLPPLFKKTKFVWTDEHEQHLNVIKEKIAEATENKHFL